jgi:hypothetical protein
MEKGVRMRPLIADRKRIGEKLGVHCEREIPLAAYRAHFFSILH